MNQIELITTPCSDGADCYQVCFLDGDPVVRHIPLVWLDLAGFLAARVLIEQGFDASRQLIVHLQGADYLLMSAQLGAAAAKPIVNTSKPVQRAAHSVEMRR